MRRTRPHCTLLRTQLCVPRSRAQACVFGEINLGDLVKIIRQIKIPAKISSYTVRGNAKLHMTRSGDMRRDHNWR